MEEVDIAVQRRPVLPPRPRQGRREPPAALEPLKLSESPTKEVRGLVAAERYAEADGTHATKKYAARYLMIPWFYYI